MSHAYGVMAAVARADERDAARKRNSLAEHRALAALGRVCASPRCYLAPMSYSQSCYGHTAPGVNANARGIR